jgi:hypothetical protein
LVFILGVHAHFFATFARLGHAVRHLAARDEMHTKQRTTLHKRGPRSNDQKRKAATEAVQTKGKERQQSHRHSNNIA